MKNKNSKLKLAVIGTAGVPGRYGGFETLAHQMVEHMQDSHDLTVYCSKNMYTEAERKKPYPGAKRVFIPLNANGVQSILYDIVSMLHALWYADYLVIFGVSGCLLLPFIRLFSNKKIVVNIDGLEWKREKWSFFARKFLEFSEYLAVRFSHADITDNAAIREYTAERYGTVSNLIEYGGDQAFHVPADHFDRLTYPCFREPYAFSVCRIEPENNLHLLLEAYAQLPGEHLVVVGNWDRSTYGRDLRKKYGSHYNLTLLDPIYDPILLNKLRSNCKVYLHGHSAGGTNPSLVEAMWLGLPVLCYDVVYNRETTEHSAYYFRDAGSLVKLVTELRDSDYFILRSAMGKIAGKRYTWNKIFSSYAQLIDNLEAGYKKEMVSEKTANRLPAPFLPAQLETLISPALDRSQKNAAI